MLNYPLPTDSQIEQAIAELLASGALNPRYFYHESHDSTRIAFAWLDAQRTVNAGITCNPIKHMAESWGCRYCSTDSVILAANLHPRIRGKYPSFNLSRRLVWPNPERLAEIREAGIHPGYAGKYLEDYRVQEGGCHAS